MTEHRWKLIRAWKAKRQGQVWVVRSHSGRNGYFKFTRKDQWYFSGPMIANEYIAAALAAKLGLPVAKLELATVAGPDGRLQKGLVSVAARAKEVTTWNEAGEAVRSHPAKYVKRADLLRSLIVFDAWIANIDRASGKNLVLYRSSGDEKYRWYLIDHGHTLYGSPRKWARGAWNNPLWQKLWTFYHTPKGLLRLQSSWKRLDPMVRRIEKLTPAHIDQALDSVPVGCLRTNERRFIRRLLLTRKKQLRSIIRRWLAYKVRKESGR
ncbi:HipA family kinase [Gordoniibacillus kamchatkensis]|uniref:HipA family kinase n=1 Tax=Gordoniibacillus kamchatkensis TaxID=1590651 RepID=UPI0012E06712|nr:HipA family kinase [Paenibacillus sp. VKM B-2647]